VKLVINLLRTDISLLLAFMSMNATEQRQELTEIQRNSRKSDISAPIEDPDVVFEREVQILQAVAENRPSRTHWEGAKNISDDAAERPASALKLDWYQQQEEEEEVYDYDSNFPKEDTSPSKTTSPPASPFLMRVEPTAEKEGTLQRKTKGGNWGPVLVKLNVTVKWCSLFSSGLTVLVDFCNAQLFTQVERNGKIEPLLFNLRTCDGDILFRTKDEEDKQEWVSQFRKACFRDPSRMSSPPKPNRDFGIRKIRNHSAPQFVIDEVPVPVDLSSAEPLLIFDRKLYEPVENLLTSLLDWVDVKK